LNSDPRVASNPFPEDVSFVTEHWAMELLPGTNPYEIAKKHGHEVVGPVGSLPNVFLFKKKSETIHGVTHPQHTESPEITWFENQIAHQRMKRGFIPSDPLYGAQWHLHRTSDDVNINTEPAWQQNITGEGVIIAVVDDGLENTHPGTIFQFFITYHRRFVSQLFFSRQLGFQLQ
jgi:hypothetical protein